MNRRSVSNPLRLAVRSGQGAAVNSRFTPAGWRSRGVVGLSLAGIASLFLCITSATKASSAGDSLSEKMTAAITSVTRKTMPTVVRVRCTDGHGELNGTGFYIGPTGTICTLAEIVRNGSNIMVMHNGLESPASLLAIDSRSGVAFLKTEGNEVNGSFITARSIATPPPMTPVVGIGFIRDEHAIPSLGMITGTEIRGGDHYYCLPHITATIPLGEGEGGSPILDLKGELIGMVVAGSTQPPSCRILPATALEKLNNDLLRYGRLESGWLGIVVEQAAVPQGTSTARIVSVEAGSPAESAGLKSGDMLVSLAGHQISNPEQVPGITFYLTAGDSVSTSVLRDGKVLKFDLHCIQRPDLEPAGQISDKKTPLLGQPTKLRN